jgi:hypothetical protein
MWRELRDNPGYYATITGEVSRRLRTKFRENEYKKLKGFYRKGQGGAMVTLYHPETGARTYRKIA